MVWFYNALGVKRINSVESVVGQGASRGALGLGLCGGGRVWR